MRPLVSNQHPLRMLGQDVVLLGHQHGHTFAGQLQQGVAHGRHQHRGDALARLVQQQKARARHEGAGQRQHLLLAAAHLAGWAVQHGLQLWEQSHHAVKAQRRRGLRAGR
jgi:hypothetical protein